MAKLLVFGHQNPDTDTVASAIAFAHLQNALGNEAEAVILGEVNEETAFALNYFNTETPRIVSSVANETSYVALVDHNERQQSVSDLHKVTVTHVIDHHRIANFETAQPLYYRAEPVGCTSTILLSLFNEHGVAIPQHIAGLMLSAIISDTLLFKSPTGTNKDVAAAQQLAEIAQVDVNAYGLDMLKAGTNLDNKTISELLNIDAKSFPMGGKIVRIAQINTVDEQAVLSRSEEILREMAETSAVNAFDLFVFVITNILTSDSTVLVTGEPQSAVEQAFNVTLNQQQAVLPGVVSRKKQVVPPLTAVLS